MSLTLEDQASRERRSESRPPKENPRFERSAWGVSTRRQPSRHENTMNTINDDCGGSVGGSGESCSILTPHGMEVCDSERLSYQDAKTKLKRIVKDRLAGEWSPISIGCYLSKCLIFEFPTDDLYRPFVTKYGLGLRWLFPNLKIQTNDNHHELCIFDPQVLFPDDQREKVAIGIVSDNITFLMDNAEISFRSFGHGDIELSSLFVNRNHRDKGIGTALVELAKETAKMIGCRVLLFPFPTLSECEAWSSPRRADEANRLTRWYSKLGFLKTLPEMREGTRLGGDRKMLVGICGMMAFR
jgi:GNAT superfamily N-acetyltransferase